MRAIDIPARGWRDIFVRVKHEVKTDNLALVAAGVAFLFFLSLFPALAALVSIYGLISDPAQVKDQVMAMPGIMPDEARPLLGRQMSEIVSQSREGLGLGVAASILLALWSANKGTWGLVQGINIAYDQKEERGWFRRKATTLAFTCGAILFALIALAGVVAVPIVLGMLGLSSVTDSLIRWLRWPLLAIIVAFGIGLLYRYGPSRRPARWRWVNWGAVAATAMWLAASAGFSFYVSHFGSYNKTYGSIATIVIVLLWLHLGAFSVLLGAELNCEIERQTARDTTTGPERPMGARGAVAADTVGQPA
jgi:membrane protein